MFLHNSQYFYSKFVRFSPEIQNFAVTSVFFSEKWAKGNICFSSIPNLFGIDLFFSFENKMFGWKFFEQKEGACPPKTESFSFALTDWPRWGVNGLSIVSSWTQLHWQQWKRKWRKKCYLIQRECKNKEIVNWPGRHFSWELKGKFQSSQWVKKKKKSSISQTELARFTWGANQGTEHSCSSIPRCTKSEINLARFWGICSRCGSLKFSLRLKFRQSMMAIFLGWRTGCMGYKERASQLRISWWLLHVLDCWQALKEHPNATQH